MKPTCPVDQKPLSLTQSDRLEVMSCEACKGAWLPATSAGSLLSRLAADTPERQKFFEKVRDDGHPSSMECLDCKAELLTIEHRDVDIDVCPDCGGIWFDGGELERFRKSGFSKPAKIAAAAVGATALAAAGVAGAGALGGSPPVQQAASAASGVGEAVFDGAIEVAGEVIVAILSSIFD